jgi:hypothetical protein
MSDTSYGSGLRGTRTLTDTLGLIEAMEGYGKSETTLGDLYGDSVPGVGSEGNATIGYGFNLSIPNVLNAVSDGLLPAGVNYLAGGLNQNVFVAGAAAASAANHPVMSQTQVLSYFRCVVGRYLRAASTGYILTVHEQRTVVINEM